VPPPPMKTRAPTVSVPADIEALVQRLLAKRPEDRFQTPTELIAAIDALAAKHRWSWANGSSHSLPLVAPAAPTLPEPALASPAGGPASRTLSHLRTQVAPLLAKAKAQPRWLLATAAAALVALLVWALWPGQSSKVGPDEPVVALKPAAPRPARPEALAPQPELDAAVAQGREALELLAGRYPSDPRIGHALVRVYSSHRLHVEAMHAIARLATLEPELDRNAEIARLIVAALGAAPEASEAAATLMEQDLGSAGVDLLYDLTTRQTQARWKGRLHQALAKPEVLAKASPGTRAALDLRTAKSCDAKRALLPRVARDGDQRALTQLRGLVGQQGCGFFNLGDCWPCLRRDRVLQETISAVEARLK